MAAMKEKQILVVIKEPGKEPYVEPLFDNTLKAFQKAVDECIETVTIFTDLILICNEEGRITNRPFNANIAGIDFYGTVLAVGCRGDNFSSLKGYNIPHVLNLMKGDT